MPILWLGWREHMQSRMRKTHEKVTWIVTSCNAALKYHLTMIFWFTKSLLHRSVLRVECINGNFDWETEIVDKLSITSFASRKMTEFLSFFSRKALKIPTVEWSEICGQLLVICRRKFKFSLPKTFQYSSKLISISEVWVQLTRLSGGCDGN
jgi:hypothetical protein